MRESKVETYLHEKVVAAGGWTYKFVSPGRANVPDRIVIWPLPACFPIRADVHFVETKATGVGVRAGQKREHVRLEDWGCVVLVIDTKRKVDAYVKRNRT